MTRQLIETADDVVCIEPNLNCAAQARAALGDHPRVTIRVEHLEESDTSQLANRFDTVVCVNVLEHIEDDVRALRVLRDVVAGTGGQVLIWVPAVQAIYGPHDAALGHHRRYSKASLTKAFDSAGLELVAIGSSNPIGLLSWNYRPVRQRKPGRHAVQVGPDRLIAPWALPIERFVANRPVGRRGGPRPRIRPA